MEQKTNMKFCFKMGKTATETLEMLRSVYGEETLSRKTVFQWFKCFREGRESVEDEHRSGRPVTSRTTANVERVRKLLLQDRRLSVRIMANELNLPREIVRTILTKNLGKRKLCVTFVPHNLSDAQKQQRIDSCGDFINAADKDDAFLQSIVTGDETWCFAYDPQTKRQSMEWRGPSSPKSRKFRFKKSKIKTMLITFFDAQGIIHKEFVPEGQTVNGEFYCHVMKRLLARIRRVRPHLAASGKFVLLHDNARPHTAMCVRRFPAQQQVTELFHPPYSPDLAPADFFLFPRLKLALKGHRFSNTSDIQAAVTKELKTVSKEDFCKSFQNLYERCQKCIVDGGNYFEQQ